MTRFDGREGALSLDGEVTSGMLGADWSRDALTAGLVVSHSLGEGSYQGESGNGGVTSLLIRAPLGPSAPSCSRDPSLPSRDRRFARCEHQCGAPRAVTTVTARANGFRMSRGQNRGTECRVEGGGEY